jgi:hypothetical protein
MSRFRLCTALSLILLLNSHFFSGSESAHAQTRTTPQQQSVRPSSPQPAPPRSRSTPNPKALVAPPPSSVSPEVKDCPEACKTVTVQCGTPASPPPVAPTGFSSWKDTSQGLIKNSSSNSWVSCGEKMFVQRNGNGACMVCVGTGPFSDLLKDPANNQCGMTISVEEFLNRYDKFRNGLLNLDLSKALENLTGADLLNAINSLYALLQDICILSDELYHLVNKYPCYHHPVCDEANSTQNHLNCSNNPSVLAFVEKLLAYLDKTNLFSGVESDRDALKQAIIATHCGNLGQLKVSDQIESCLCCATRDGTESVTQQDCADCAAKFCPQGGSPSTSYGGSNSGTPSFCAGFDDTLRRKQECEHFLTETGPHTCDRYVNMPVQKLMPSTSTMMSNPATSPTGRITCSIAPPPVPTCDQSSGRGAENICLTAPPLR